MADRPRWCPDCEVLGRGSDRCWNCGRPLEPADEPLVARMRDLLDEPDDEPPPESTA